MLRHQTESIQNPVDFVSRKAGDKARAEQNGLIFQNQPHRYRNFQIAGANRPNDLKAGSTIGSKTSHQNRGVENCKHIRYYARYRVERNLLWGDFILLLNPSCLQTNFPLGNFEHDDDLHTCAESAVCRGVEIAGWVVAPRSEIDGFIDGVWVCFSTAFESRSEFRYSERNKNSRVLANPAELLRLVRVLGLSSPCRPYRPCHRPEAWRELCPSRGSR